MESQRIVFKVPGGGIGIITPFDCGLTIEQIALKDVPTGAPFKIVDVSDIPADRTWRASWDADVSDLTDGVGA